MNSCTPTFLVKFRCGADMARREGKGKGRGGDREGKEKGGEGRGGEGKGRGRRLIKHFCVRLQPCSPWGTLGG